MLKVSAEALKHLGDIGGDQQGTTIRVAPMGSGGTHSGLGLIIDEATDNDISVEHDHYTVIVDKGLLEYCKNISIDFTKGQPDRCESRSKRGFLIKADNPLNL